ncbi:MAG: RNB domain-containing ribonuclease, partial [Cyanobacteria bacterium J083]
IGLIKKERGKYRKNIENNLVEAKLRCSSKGFCFAIQDDEESDDIYVRESHLSNAWNGDRVLVEVIKEGTRRRSPEGQVKLILDRANPTLLATVSATETGNFHAIPLDDRLLFELNLQEEAKEENLAAAVDHLVHVEVTRYPIGQYPPQGKINRILGSDAEAAADTDIVSCKHNLPQTFSEQAIEAAKSLSSRILSKEIKRRLDLRQLPTIAIVNDNEGGAKPIVENAITLDKTKSGDWQIGIHVTDVAHYIEPGSILDREAKKRGTAVNLRKLIIPLLPSEANKAIGLNEGKDNLTLSILLTINPQGELVDYTIAESVINVDRALTYTEIQSLLQNQAETSPEDEAIVAILKELLFNISPLIKAQRIQRGCFEISLSNVGVLNQDEGRVGAIVVNPALPIRSLLTEIFILGNKAVADHLVALGVPAIFCTQAEPDLDVLEDLLKLGGNLGLNLALQSPEKVSPQDYQHFTQEFNKSSAVNVLHHILRSTLKPLQYSTEPGSYFGLAYSDSYTQWCSPAQRYADLFIQRVLKAVLTEGRDRRHNRTKEGVNLGSNTCHGNINWKVLPTAIQSSLEEDLPLLVAHLNERNKITEDAEKDLDGLQKAEKMKERTGKIFEGLITGVQSYGFFVEIEDLLVEGLVHVSSLKDDWYEYRSRHSCLVGRKNRIAYRLGDRVEVEVKSVDYYRQQIDLVTVGGGSAASNADLEEE